VDHLIKGGLRPVGMRLVRMSRAQAEGFYAVHRERPFFKDLVAFMTSGPALVMVLEGENAIARNRELMGATDSKKAAAGTIRQKYGTDIERNAVHGSDAPETAKFEISWFFAGSDLG
jgi:nucleoside-diphosphate kinase